MEDEGGLAELARRGEVREAEKRAKEERARQRRAQRHPRLEVASCSRLGFFGTWSGSVLVAVLAFLIPIPTVADMADGVPPPENFFVYVTSVAIGLAMSGESWVSLPFGAGIHG